MYISRYIGTLLKDSYCTHLDGKVNLAQVLAKCHLNYKFVIVGIRDIFKGG